MKNIFLLFLILIFANFSAQQNALKCVQNPQKAAHISRPALMKNAATIKIVSYSWRHRSDEMVGVTDSIFAKKLPLETAYKEVKTLDAKGKAQLLDLLFGYFYAGKPKVFMAYNCYNPHNAIFFYDAKGTMTAFLELCFECSRYRSSDPSVSVGDECTGKFRYIKAFFKKQGIKNVGDEF